MPSSGYNMDVESFSKCSVPLYQIIQCHIPEVSNHHDVVASILASYSGVHRSIQSPRSGYPDPGFLWLSSDSRHIHFESTLKNIKATFFCFFQILQSSPCSTSTADEFSFNKLINVSQISRKNLMIKNSYETKSQCKRGLLLLGLVTALK
jgi:hypothetical protein